MKKIFEVQKPIIGMIHLKPLPGSPNYDKNKFDMNAIVKYAVEEAKILEQAGVNGLQIENYWDKYKSAKINLYEDTVTDKMVNYLQPQENGAKTDVRYLEIKNEKVDKGEEILKSIVKDDILEIRDNEEKQD